jgi:hypothetical protein
MEHEALGSSCFKEGSKLEYITGLTQKSIVGKIRNFD